MSTLIWINVFSFWYFHLKKYFQGTLLLQNVSNLSKMNYEADLTFMLILILMHWLKTVNELDHHPNLEFWILAFVLCIWYQLSIVFNKEIISPKSVQYVLKNALYLHFWDLGRGVFRVQNKELWSPKKYQDI